MSCWPSVWRSGSVRCCWSAAILIKATSRGPLVFRQVRCGLNGRTFTLYKFRSMVVDAEERLGEVAHLNQKEIVTKIPNDPRLTAVGKWLRRFSIDELPQLFNVLRGDMSMVGPRPAIPSEVAQYQRWQRRRLRMRPGLTSLWAVEGRDQVDFEKWMRLDMQYIDNWSLALDARIILRTIPQVLSGRRVFQADGSGAEPDDEVFDHSAIVRPGAAQIAIGIEDQGESALQLRL